MKISPIAILYLASVVVCAILLVINPEIIMVQGLFLGGVVITAVSIFYFMSQQIGVGKTFLLFVLSAGVGFVMEYLGVNEGTTFSHYYYTDFLGPKIGNVPYLIPISWFTALTTAFLAARLILGFGKRTNKLLLFTLASLLSVVYDLPIEYMAMYVWESWVWPDGGIFLGVPLLNFIGWFVVAFIVFGLGAGAWRSLNKTARGYHELQIVCFSAFALTVFHMVLDILTK